MSMELLKYGDLTQKRRSQRGCNQIATFLNSPANSASSTGLSRCARRHRLSTLPGGSFSIRYNDRDRHRVRHPRLTVPVGEPYGKLVAHALFAPGSTHRLS